MESATEGPFSQRQSPAETSNTAATPTASETRTPVKTIVSHSNAEAGTADANLTGDAEEGPD